MLKTNNKQALNNIENYIVDMLEASSDLYNASVKELLAAAIDWYYSGAAYKVSSLPGSKITFKYKESLAEFMTNSALIFEPYPHAQRQAIKEWLDETEAEAEKYENDEVEQLYFRLLNKVLNKMMIKYDLNILYSLEDVKRNNQFIVSY